MKVEKVDVVDIDALKKGTTSLSKDSSPVKSTLKRGIIMQQSNISFVKAADSSIRLKGNR